MIERGQLPYQLGLKPSSLDHRDFKLKTVYTAEIPPPPKADLSPHIDWMYDQGKESSCVCNSGSTIIRFIRKQLGLPEIDPSRNFLYYTGRDLEGGADRDEGMEIRDFYKAAAATGYCDETLWGYTIAAVNKKPSDNAYQAASHNLIGKDFMTVDQSNLAIRSCLAGSPGKPGLPIQIGIEVCQSMMSNAVAQSGMVPIPAPDDPVLGGHAVVLVGYEDSTKLYKVMNSWGSDWGQDGYFYLPYEYVESSDLTSDFWTLEGVAKQTIKKHGYWTTEEVMWPDVNTWIS